MRCPGACLRETGKLTWKHLWPRVYSVFSSERCLTGRDFTQKRWDIHIYDPLIMVMIKSTSMNLVNVLVHFNQLLWYFCSFPHIQYRHPPSHLPSQKEKSAVSKTLFFHFICVVVKTKSLMIFSLSCNYNNYMTYNWPNSAFFNFQKNANQENCRHSSCILFFIDKLEQRTWRGENLSLNRVFSQVGQ